MVSFFWDRGSIILVPGTGTGMTYDMRGMYRVNGRRICEQAVRMLSIRPKMSVAREKRFDRDGNETSTSPARRKQRTPQSSRFATILLHCD